VLASYVERRIADHGGQRDLAVERCVDRILASEGRVALADLVALSVMSERRLQRRFAKVVGISPRALASVVRLRRVFDAMRDRPLSTWSHSASRLASGLPRDEACPRAWPRQTYEACRKATSADHRRRLSSMDFALAGTP